jgi:hypothetical protein
MGVVPEARSSLLVGKSSWLSIQLCGQPEALRGGLAGQAAGRAVVKDVGGIVVGVRAAHAALAVAALVVVGRVVPDGEAAAPVGADVGPQAHLVALGVARAGLPQLALPVAGQRELDPPEGDQRLAQGRLGLRHLAVVEAPVAVQVAARMLARAVAVGGGGGRALGHRPRSVDEHQETRLDRLGDRRRGLAEEKYEEPEGEEREPRGTHDWTSLRPRGHGEGHTLPQIEVRRSGTVLSNIRISRPPTIQGPGICLGAVPSSIVSPCA